VTIIAHLQVCSIFVALILQIAMRMLSAFYYLIAAVNYVWLYQNMRCQLAVRACKTKLAS
jgi:hypothetical protein